MPHFIAHRGNSFHFPENTLTAFKEARGADGIETDIQLSRDGVPVIFHDRTLEKLDLPDKKIHELTWAELSQLDAGGWFSQEFTSACLMTLHDFLSAFSSETLLLEIKAREGEGQDPRWEEIVDATLKEIRQFPPQKNLFILCFNIKVLKMIREKAPDIRCVPNFSQFDPKSDSIDQWDAVSVNINCLDETIAQYIHQKNKQLMTFTCNDTKQLSQALACQAGFILSDKPHWAKEAASQLMKEKP